ncbi:hypothetical protein E2C01_069300 [Portunus trituberculatus]|uniref:Uncharacterized protein n=1 Tax=Portunus trituberculatus TaxID=210409 RepID=A0A5B7HR30_PORTR|nr:hypothetical protein [Portunus trituberculatus]
MATCGGPAAWLSGGPGAAERHPPEGGADGVARGGPS